MFFFFVFLNDRETFCVFIYYIHIKIIINITYFPFLLFLQKGMTYAREDMTSCLS